MFQAKSNTWDSQNSELWNTFLHNHPRMLSRAQSTRMYRNHTCRGSRNSSQYSRSLRCSQLRRHQHRLVLFRLLGRLYLGRLVCPGHLYRLEVQLVLLALEALVARLLLEAQQALEDRSYQLGPGHQSLLLSLELPSALEVPQVQWCLGGQLPQVHPAGQYHPWVLRGQLGPSVLEDLFGLEDQSVPSVLEDLEALSHLYRPSGLLLLCPPKCQYLLEALVGRLVLLVPGNQYYLLGPSLQSLLVSPVCLEDLYHLSAPLVPGVLLLHSDLGSQHRLEHH